MDTHTHTAAPAAPAAPVELEIEGMTCASCAARIEKRLNKLDGVEATVNYATERARVTAPEGVSSDDLVAQVEAAGYKARVPGPTHAAGPMHGAHADSSEHGSAHQHEGEPIVVFNCEGDFFAIEDRCSHDDGPLAEGELDCAAGTVECPRHGSLFDLRSGRAKTLPAYQPVRVFPVEITDDTITLEV